MSKYKFVEGTVLSRGITQDVGEALEELHNDEGCLYPSDVVHLAAQEGSILHPYLHWDNIRPPVAWRRHQASQIIESLLLDDKLIGRDVPAFYCVPPAHGGPDVYMTPQALTESKVAWHRASMRLSQRILRDTHAHDCLRRLARDDWWGT